MRQPRPTTADASKLRKVLGPTRIGDHVTTPIMASSLTWSHFTFIGSIVDVFDTHLMAQKITDSISILLGHTNTMVRAAADKILLLSTRFPPRYTTCLFASMTCSSALSLSITTSVFVFACSGCRHVLTSLLLTLGKPN